MSGQGEPHSALWLATRASKMALSCRIGIARCIPREKLVLPVPNTKILYLCSKIYVAYLICIYLWKRHNWNYMNSWYLGLHLSSTQSSSQCKWKDSWPVPKSLIYLHSQQPLACGTGSCQNGGSCVEQCDGKRKCICAEGYTGVHCENTLTTETLRKRHNRNLSFVIILSIQVVIYKQ